jgi:hypothetical protein
MQSENLTACARRLLGVAALVDTVAPLGLLDDPQPAIVTVAMMIAGAIAGTQRGRVILL